MKIEDQVCSRDLAMRLEELGVKQESFFCWSVSDCESMTPCVELTPYAASVHGKGVDCAAFTVTELGEMLPGCIATNHLYSYQQARNWTDKHARKHRLVYWFAGKIELFRVDDDSEANCRAKMLVYLLDNQFVQAANL